MNANQPVVRRFSSFKRLLAERCVLITSKNARFVRRADAYLLTGVVLKSVIGAFGAHGRRPKPSGPDPSELAQHRGQPEGRLIDVALAV